MRGVCVIQSHWSVLYFAEHGKNCLAVIIIGNQTGKLSLGKELDKDMLLPIIFNFCIQDLLDKVREDMEMGWKYKGKL